jgi:PAS domain S-box-containing protein
MPNARGRAAGLLHDGGIMGARVRAYDWSVSPIGTPDTWPQALRTALGIMLSSAFPTYMAWGPELTSFYNDAYIPIMGDKPEGLGRPFPEVWAEVWPTIGPITERAMGGEASYFEDLPLTLTRRGYAEKTWFSFSYSPIRDESGGVGGVLCTVLETTQRVIAETALRESEERFRQLTNLIPTFVWYVDPQATVTFANEQWFTYTGLTDEPAERWPELVFAPEERDRNRASWLRALEDGTPFDIEARIRRHDGEYRWFLTRAIPVRDDEGDITGWFSAATDIHDRRMAEEALRESEARIAAILEQVPIGVGLADPQGSLTLGNETLRRYGVGALPSNEPGEAGRWRAFSADGRPLSEADHPGARALRGEVVIPGIDFIFARPEGGETWTRVSAAPFRNAAQEITGAIVVMQDIDREKRAEERFREFAAHSTDGLWIVDTKTLTLDYFNPAFERVFGSPSGALRLNSSRWRDVVHGDDRSRVSEAFGRAAQGVVASEEFRILRADGAVRWLRSTFFPIRDEHGDIRRAGGIAQDITRHEGRFVYVVGGAEGSRHALERLLQDAGYDVRAFPSGKAFLEAAPALKAGCGVLDLRHPEGGLTVLRELKARHIGLPMVVVGEAGGDVAFAVEVMKAGAVDFLPTPYGVDRLLAAVASAAADIRRAEERSQEADRARTRLAELSEREREVLDGLLAGKTNKEIGRDMGISPRTVEIHRANVMHRLDARTLPELVRIAAVAGLEAQSRPAP